MSKIGMAIVSCGAMAQGIHLPNIRRHPDIDLFQEMFAIVDQVKKTGIKFCVGHNRRMALAIREARRIYIKHKTNPASNLMILTVVAFHGKLWDM